MVANILLTTKRAQPDIETGVAFLSTRLNSLTEQDKK